MPASAIQPLVLRDLWFIAPQILLTVWGLLVLIVDFTVLRKRSQTDRRNLLGGLSLLGTVVVLGTLLWPSINVSMGAEWDFTDPDPSIFFGTLAGDVLTSQFNGLLTLLLAMVIAVSMAWNFTEDWGAYFALLFWATVGMMFLVAAEELLILFLTLEMMTICLYLAAAFEKDRRRSPEAGMKYFVYGSVSSALFLFGLSLLYGMTGTTYLAGIRQGLMLRTEAAALGGIMPGLVNDITGATAVLLVLVGFGFKVAAVPFHQWAPDVYEGAPAPVAAWIAAGSKIASFIALMKVLIVALGPWASQANDLTGPGWIMVIALIAAATMTYGNLAALVQRNLKRMLAYSSIAHAGYLLVGVLAATVSIRRNPTESAGSVLFYLVIYGITTVGAFAAAAWLVRDRGRDDIEDLNGLGHESPGLAVCIVILMLSLIGIPPLAGFFAKLYMFMEVVHTQDAAQATMLTLVAIALANSVISAFYYVRVLKAMFFRPADRPFPAAPRSVAWPIGFATLVAIGFGFFPAPLLESMRGSADAMLTISMPTEERFRTRFDLSYDPALDPSNEPLEDDLIRVSGPAGMVAPDGGASSSPPTAPSAVGSN